MDALIEFIKILVPASVVLYGIYLVVRMLIQKEVDLKKLEVRGRSIETVLPNRLQAYERMALFFGTYFTPELVSTLKRLWHDLKGISSIVVGRDKE